MLSSLDETLMHQAPVPFAQTPVSDHRFFDRMWMGGHGADGTRFLMGMANYKNMNTSDGYFVVYRNGLQYNLRVSRPLLPDPDSMTIGPLSVTVERPLRSLRVEVQRGPDHPFAASLVFTGSNIPRLEQPHIKRVDGRLAQDYVRFDQHGRIDGWIEIEGERISADQWFGARDHSWGVRPAQGGYDPVTSNPREGEFRNEISVGQAGWLGIYLFFETAEWEGYLQHQEDGQGVIVYQDGGLREKARHSDEVGVRSIVHDLTFAPGTRACTGGRLQVTLVDGETVDIDITALTPATCYKGTGYDAGFNDERGLGLHRGELLESDVYRMTDIEAVELPDGRVIRPWHREVPCSLAVNGGARGLGYFPVLSNGTIQRYGLNSPITNRRD